MTATTLFGLCGAALVGVGLFGLLTDAEPLRKILAFNLVGGGVFLVFGVVARRGASAGLGGDPVPQALVITAIVVAFAATALAISLLQRLLEKTDAISLAVDDGTGTSVEQGSL
jgi:multicomponent Na+:H+ antiporter subunit C